MPHLSLPPGAPGWTPAVSLAPDDFARAFPFHFACNRDLRVVQAGQSLDRIAPEVLPGARLVDSFDLARPNRELTAAEIEARLGSLMLLEHRRSKVLFRGQFVTAQGAGWVFLGSPWFMTAEELEAAGLSLADFAAQDSIAELLLVSQTQQIAIANLSQLNAQLSLQRETLRRTESLYRSAIAASYGVAYQESFDDDTFVYVGEDFEDLTRFAPGQLPPSQLRRLERAQESSELAGQTNILRSGDSTLRRRSDYEFVRGDGKTRWFSDSSVLVKDADGRPSGAIGILFDITLRKEGEERLRASEEEARRLAIVAARTSSAVILLDAERRAIWCNDALSRLTGFGKQDLIGRMVRDVLDIESLDPAVAAASNEAMRAGAEFRADTRLRRADGTIIWVSAEVQTLRDKTGRISGFIVVGTDINATKLYEQRLDKVGKELEAILGVIPGGVVALNEDSVVAYSNAAFEAMLGCSRQELSSMTASDLDRKLAALCHGDHEPAGFLELGEGDVDMVRIARPSPAILARTVRIVKDPEAATQWRAYYLRDVTREAEVDRMKSEFLSHAAHELRTPMSSVHGFAELLISRDFDAETSRTIARTIHRQSSLLVQMVNELLDLARIEAGRGLDFVMTSERLEPIVRDVVDSMLVPGDDRRAELIPSDAERLLVHVDSGKLRQALTNVLANAFKYSRGSGSIRVWLPQRRRRGVTEVGIRVSDEGIGMTPEQVSRIFERFYRADPAGDIPGTGLGMTLVNSLVEAMGGQTEVTSELNRGTTVTLWLPVARS